MLTPRFGILGPVEIRTDGPPVSVPRSQRRGVLTYLLLHAEQWVTMDGLSAAVWGPSGPASARSQLHSTAYSIRRHLRTAGCAATLTGRAGGYQLSLNGEDVDLSRFERQVSAARDDVTDQHWAAAAGRLQSGLDLWRGEALADATGAFVTAWRSSLHDRRLGAVELLIECRLHLGAGAEVLPALRELVAQHPLHERFCEQLMLALYREGRREEALQQYQRLRRALAEQQGLDPGSSIATLQKAILLGEDPEPGPGRIVAEPPVWATPGPAVPWRPPVPAQLPPAAVGFVGRDDELGALDRMLHDPCTDGTVAVIVGGAGVGKTGLAVHWSSARRAHAPDGQLFVDLHGFGPQPPLTAELALDHLLRALGVPARDMPPGLDERSALYRSLLAGRRCLVILDNARDSEQVRPLIAGGGTITVVTSRRRLDGLVVHDGAIMLSIASLPARDGRKLLGALTGHEPSEPAVGRLADLCDQLPLALRIAAARLRASPHVSVGAMAAALTDEHQRLRALSVEEDSVAVRAAFDLSYRALSAPAARLFRLLGLFPGPAPSRAACAALLGSTPGETRALLDELVDTHLVAATGPDRYALHDLLLLFARDVSADDPPQLHAAAERRLLNWYLAAADAGEALLRPAAKRISPELEAVRDPVRFADADAALDWLDGESVNLVALIGRWTTRHQRAVWQLAANLAGWLMRRASRTTWVEVMEAAARAAAVDGAPEGEAQILNSLAIAYSHLRQSGAALAAYRRARTLRDEIGDRYGAAVVTMNMGCLHSELGEVAEAIAALETALAALTALPDGIVAVRVARLNLAYAYRMAGRHAEALALNTAVLTDAVNARDDELACNAHVNVAELHRLLGAPEAALRHYRLALTMAQGQRNRTYERWALRGLGGVNADQGRHRQAAVELSAAVRLYRDSDDPAADEVRRELREVRSRLAADSTEPG
ncbi:BTAD domain-containing putative transcriptional regulator [Micromonospora sp. CPCC 205539]|uniref:AfsR/SARP family transcriptional regulator n=1 Tax=Micromonospora sp. CPCC 205539 TaxID=3122408 RepID=UPI002FF3DDE7